MTHEQQALVLGKGWTELPHKITGVVLRHRIIVCKCGTIVCRSGHNPRMCRKHADAAFKLHYEAVHGSKLAKQAQGIVSLLVLGALVIAYLRRKRV